MKDWGYRDSNRDEGLVPFISSHILNHSQTIAVRHLEEEYPVSKETMVATAIYGV
jgi:hypothetical protein